MINHEAVQTALRIAELNAEDQALFIKALEATGALTHGEIRSVLVTVGFYRLQIFPEMANAVKAEMARSMYTAMNASKV